MKLDELFRAVNTVAQNGGTPVQCETLAREAENFADMVGWAQGEIDPQGQLLDRLAQLQSDIQTRFTRTNELALTLLNDSLTRLGQAIARHDDDLTAGSDAEDHNEEPD